jgi:putative alpha-1,2-mannosidase
MFPFVRVSLLNTLSVLLLAGSTLFAENAIAQDRASLVNPLVGTANGGNVFPGATMPFGMVQFSPEATPVNQKRMIAAPGGYEYRATKIRGFSLTNVEGWGCAGGSGDVPFMPIIEDVVSSPSSDFRQAYSAPFTHDDEKAEPGSYQVTLGNGSGYLPLSRRQTGACPGANVRF